MRLFFLPDGGGKQIEEQILHICARNFHLQDLATECACPGWQRRHCHEARSHLFPDVICCERMSTSISVKKGGRVGRGHSEDTLFTLRLWLARVVCAARCPLFFVEETWRQEERGLEKEDGGRRRKPNDPELNNLWKKRRRGHSIRGQGHPRHRRGGFPIGDEDFTGTVVEDHITKLDTLLRCSPKLHPIRATSRTPTLYEDKFTDDANTTNEAPTEAATELANTCGIGTWAITIISACMADLQCATFLRSQKSRILGAATFLQPQKMLKQFIVLGLAISVTNDRRFLPTIHHSAL